jgi:hypothetical protein
MFYDSEKEKARATTTYPFLEGVLIQLFSTIA